MKSLLIAAKSLSSQRNLELSEVLNAFEQGIATSLKKEYPKGAMFHVSIQKDGSIKIYRKFKLVDKIEPNEIEFSMLENEVEDEEVIQEEGVSWALEPLQVDLSGRQRMTVVRQVAMTILDKMELNQKIEDLLSGLGSSPKIFTAVVKERRKTGVLLEIEGVLIKMPFSEALQKDFLKVDKTITVTLIQKDGEFIASRADNSFLLELLKREVSEINDGTIDVVKVARIPGISSKVFLRSFGGNYSPVRAVLGKHNLMKYLHTVLEGEFVEFIEITDEELNNQNELLLKAIGNIDVSNIFNDELERKIAFSVNDEDYDIAKSKIPLLKKVMGCDVSVYKEKEWQAFKERDENKIIFKLMHSIDELSGDIAKELFNAGIYSAEELAYAKESDILSLLYEFDEDDVLALREMARESLRNEKKQAEVANLEIMLDMGLTYSDFLALKKNGVVSAKDIADLSTYELLEIVNDPLVLEDQEEMSEEQAGKIIMQAREMDGLFDRIRREKRERERRLKTWWGNSKEFGASISSGVPSQNKGALV